mgnify:CR=1 FL=1
MATRFVQHLQMFVCLTLVWTAVHPARSKPVSPIQRPVLALNPIGYWPADEGSGRFLRDLSGHRNHARLRNVPWKNGLVHFTGAYQWAEIPNHRRYQTKAFSIGGWVYTRSSVTGGPFSGTEGMTFIGNAYGSTGYDIDSLYEEPILYKKSKLFGGGVPYDHRENGISICIRRGELVDIVSGGKDALDSRADKIGISVGEWQHVLYTYRAEDVPLEGGHAWKSLLEKTDYPGSTGTGTLYVNGKRVQSKENVPFAPRNMPFLVGSDAVWWLQAHQSSGSLNGSLRDIVMFDRTLSPAEVKRLCEATRPRVQPAEVPRLDDAHGKARITAGSLPKLISVLKDSSKPEAERAEAALAMAELKSGTAEAVPVLTGVLRTCLDSAQTRLPRVEELLRNAVTRALLDIAPKTAETQRLLARALPTAAEKGHRFFSQGDPDWDRRPHHPNERAYTAVTSHEGSTYTLGPGEAFNAVEPVSAEAVARAIDTLAAEYPEAETWREPDSPHLYRVNILKTEADGSEQSAYLGGEHFIFYGADAKVRGWSVAVDNAGCVHITGGQHNAPNPAHYIPGSWERIGLSRDRKDDAFPQQLYWVSKKPRSIDDFEFVGRRNDPRRLPPTYWNYMNFVQDNDGELYVYGRINVSGFQSFGFYRYDADARQWSAVGGDACDIIADCEVNDPGWTERLVRQVRGRIPRQPENTALAWAWQAHFYNYCRAIWGVRFDRTNRMHIELPIHGLVDRRIMRSRSVYAYSDDSGRTFHRADGSPVELPLTINPAPAHNADLHNHDGDRWWNLYRSLVEEAGY